MDEQEKIRRQLVEEVQLIKYRIRMLDIIEEKLLQMKALAAKDINLSPEEIQTVNAEIYRLKEQVKALDSESRMCEDEKIL